MEETFYTIIEVAEKLKLSKQQIRKYIREGKLNGFKIGRQYLIEETELNRFIDSVKNGD